MILGSEKRIFLPAWSISVSLHGLIMGLLFTISAQVKPVLQEDIFQWDVALVANVMPNSHADQSEAPILPQQPQSKKSHAPATAQPSNTAYPSHHIKPPEPAMASSEPPVEAMHQFESQVEVPQRQGERAEPQSAEHGESKTESVTMADSSESTVIQPIQQDQAEATSAPAVYHADHSAQAVSGDVLLSAHAASAASASGSDVKTDNRWLVESLWRRVAELKHYPGSARLNGQEGKVIVRAVIRSDGQLADVMVQKSSGHSVLDAAALEAVKLACPIHMKQAIGKSHIVVTLPVIYQLSG